MGSALSRQGVAAHREDRDQERLWVEAARAGDQVAFNRLILKWERPIFNLALRMLGSPEEAAEVTQETFFSAYRNLKRFRLDARFSTWLYRIAANQSITRLRQRPRGAHMSLDDTGILMIDSGLSVAGQQEKRVLDAERRRRVQQALDGLPGDQKIVVELKFFQERTFVEISEVLEIPLSTVKSRFYAGLESLKTRLGDASRPGGQDHG